MVEKASNLYLSSSVSVLQENICDAEFIIATLESQAANCIFLSFLKKKKAIFPYKTCLDIRMFLSVVETHFVNVKMLFPF